MSLNWIQVRNVAAYIAVAVLIYHFWDSECDPLNSKRSPDTLTVYKFRIDTVDRIVERPPLEGQGKAKIVYRDRYVPLRADSVQNDAAFTHDSTESVFLRPFIATLDTVQGKDSAHIEFMYPEAIFRYSIFHAADTLRSFDTTKTIERTVNNYVSVPIYEKPLFVSATTAGILLTIFLLAR